MLKRFTTDIILSAVQVLDTPDILYKENKITSNFITVIKTRL